MAELICLGYPTVASSSKQNLENKAPACDGGRQSGGQGRGNLRKSQKFLLAFCMSSFYPVRKKDLLFEQGKNT